MLSQPRTTRKLTADLLVLAGLLTLGIAQPLAGQTARLAP